MKGTEKKTASRRSSIPPWPGSNLLESLTPASRLSTDSARSPTCPTIAMGALRAAAISQEISSEGPPESQSHPYTPPATMEPTNPATAPTTVFRGLTATMSLALPHLDPKAYANVSPTQVTVIGADDDVVLADLVLRRQPDDGLAIKHLHAVGDLIEENLHCITIAVDNRGQVGVMGAGFDLQCR